MVKNILESHGRTRKGTYGKQDSKLGNVKENRGVTV